MQPHVHLRSFLVAVLIVFTNTPASTSTPRKAVEQSYRSLMFTTLAGDTVLPFNRDGKTIFVFSTMYSCFDCFKKINVELQKLAKKDTIGFHISVISRRQNSNYIRRSELKTLQKILPVAQEIIFDTNSNQQIDPPPPSTAPSGLFKHLGISVSPAILIWDGSAKTVSDFLNYNDMFDKKGAIKTVAIQRLKNAILSKNSFKMHRRSKHK